MKPKEKAEDEVDDRTRRRRRRRGRSSPETHNACLPQENQVRRKSRRRSQNTRRRIQRKRRRNPAAKGTLIILPCLGSAPRCRTPRCVEYSSSEEALRRSISSARRFASIATCAIGRVFAFVASGFDCALPYGHVFIYAWSFSVLRHDVPRFLLAQKRREEKRRKMCLLHPK